MGRIRRPASAAALAVNTAKKAATGQPMALTPAETGAEGSSAAAVHSSVQAAW